MPRLDEDEFQIVAKLSACQISGTWGEGLGKLLMRVLFTQERKCPSLCLVSQ